MTEDALVATRLAWHALAERVVSPLRVQATGNEIALTPRPGGFGTYDLPDGGWVGVDGVEVVRVDGDGGERRAPITTLRAAAEHVGLASASELPDAVLSVDPAAALRLAGVFASGAAALERLVAAASQADDVSAIHLWPEHFDVAVEIGPAGRRATFGISPGDDDHAEPYAYVGPWQDPARADGWNAVGFAGAQAPVGDAATLERFFAERRDAL